jgi:hypothetical protein
MISRQPGQQIIQCPNCQTTHGIKTGKEPMGGEMSFKKTTEKLPGQADCGMTVIKYAMVDEIQTDCHPHPGQQFSAKRFPRLAILPDKEKGTLSWDSWSRLLGGEWFSLWGPPCPEERMIVSLGIHHKTQLHDNGDGHGYPDIGYLGRVLEELKQSGVE